MDCMQFLSCTKCGLHGFYSNSCFIRNKDLATNVNWYFRLNCPWGSRNPSSLSISVGPESWWFTLLHDASCRFLHSEPLSLCIVLTAAPCAQRWWGGGVGPPPYAILAPLSFHLVGQGIIIMPNIDDLFMCYTSMLASLSKCSHPRCTSEKIVVHGVEGYTARNWGARM